MVGRGGAAIGVRVLLPAGAARAGAVVELEPEESHHLRVRRALAGEEVELRDGAGLLGRGSLEPAGEHWRVRVVECTAAARPPAVALAVAAGDKDRFAWMVEKVSELGASDVIPVESARTAGVASRLRNAHIERLARRAVESVKQSGAAWATVVHEVAAFAEVVAREFPGSRWLGDAAGALPAAAVSGPVAILIGPEGGFTADERAAALELGWAPILFGAHTLRFETAAIAAAAIASLARARGTS